LEITKALFKQLNIICQNLSLANPLCDIFALLIEKAVGARLESEKTDERLTNYISWQDSKKGMTANFLRIQEPHKEILFSKWESQ